MSIPTWPRRSPASTPSSAATATPTRADRVSGAYKYLPTIVGAPDDNPVIINQAYRYNNYLGEVVLGLLPKAGGGYRCRQPRPAATSP